MSEIVLIVFVLKLDLTYYFFENELYNFMQMGRAEARDFYG